MTWFKLLRAVAGTVLAVAVLLLAPARLAFGLVFEDAEIGSSMNQPLRAWIPYRLGQGESIDAACVRLLPGPPFPTAKIPVTVNARLSLQSYAGRDYIAVESAEAVDNRIVRLIIEVKCGKSIAVTQEYMLLLYKPDNFAQPGVSRPRAISGKRKPGSSSMLKPQSAPPAGSPPQTRAESRIKSAAVRTSANEAAVTPDSPKTSAGVRKPPPRQVDKGRPVLRIEPLRGEGTIDAGGDRNFCCFRLSHELMNRDGPPLSEAGRERLRQEMRDRMSDQDLVSRMQALRDEVGTLNQQLAASAKALEKAQAPAVRGYLSYAAFAAIVLVLAFGAWLWLQKRARRNRRVPGKLDLNIDGEGNPDVNLPVAARYAPAVPEQPVPDVVTAVPARPEPPAEAAVPARPEPPVEIAVPAGPESPAESAVSVFSKPQIAPTAPVNDAAKPELSTRLDSDFSQPAPQQAPAFRPVDVDILPPDPEPDPARRATEYKNAYIAARFPEIAGGNIVLEDHASVIEGARIFYQDDQDAAKAVELLRIALSTHPEQIGVWLALFEILWLERAAPEFADLAQRYHDRGDGRDDSHWPMVAKLGRDLEPGNELYRADGLPAVEELGSNWLNAELDMMGDMVAIELRAQVLDLHETTRAATGN